MIAGHVSLAFVIAALLAYRWGVEARRCLTLGVFAAAFTLLPDVDIIFAWKEIAVILTSGLSGFVDSFWAASGEFHRGATHTLLALILSFAGFYTYYKKNINSLAFGIVSASAVYGLAAGGLMGSMVMAVFAALGLKLTDISRERIEAREFLLVAGTGLLTHPFGDVFTGNPPDFLFPLDMVLLESRVVLNADPVLNLLSVFLLEIFLLLAAVLVTVEISDEELFSLASPLALLGLLYMPFYYVIPEPTLSVSYHFVFSSVGLAIAGTIVLYIRESERGLTDLEDIISLGLNMVLTLLLAVASYLIAYLV